MNLVISCQSKAELRVIELLQRLQITSVTTPLVCGVSKKKIFAETNFLEIEKRVGTLRNHHEKVY